MATKLNLFAPQEQQMAQDYAYLLDPNNKGTVTPQERNAQIMAQDNAHLLTPTPRPAQATKPMPVVDPNDENSGMDALLSMYTSPQEEERLRKASVANQRIAAVADALRHIGNIHHTVNYAPSQQFNNPVMEEQQRYERGKALRDAANMRYMSYKQAKEAQDAKMRQWEATFNYNAAKDAAAAQALKDYRGQTLEQKGKQFEATLNYRKENDEANRKQREKQHQDNMNLGRQRVGIAAQNASNNTKRTQAYIEKLKNGGGNGTKVAPLDTPKGQITPSGTNYANQLTQMYTYAKNNGLIKVPTGIVGQMQENSKTEAQKREEVLKLLQTNGDMVDYAVNKLGWNLEEPESLSIGWDDDEDYNDEDGLTIGW